MSLLTLCRRCIKDHPQWLRASQSTIWRRFLASTPPNYYEILGIARDATQADIKAAFLAKSKKLHPDANPNDPGSHDRFIALHEAYKTLSKRSSRREYDYSLAAQLRYDQQFRQNVGQHYRGPSAWPGSSYKGFYEGEQNNPFYDESIDPNRHKSYDYHRSDDDFFGIKFLYRKIPNSYVVMGCLFFVAAGAVMHLLAWRYTKNYHETVVEETSKARAKLLNENRRLARERGNARNLQVMEDKLKAVKEKSLD